MSGARLTPKPRYLPDCPRFVYGDSGDLSMSLPATLIDYSLQAVGGNSEGDSGVRASFIVRRDELYTFTLRFYEEEWPSVQTFIDWAQQGLPFIWYPDADDDAVLFAMQLEAPAVGTKYQATPDPQYPIVLQLTITITGAAFPIVNTDALLQSELVFMEHFSISEFATRSNLSFVDGSWEYFATGGRDGGGCMVALSAAVGNGGGSYLGVDHHEETNGELHQASIISTHDLMGQSLENRPLVLHNYGHVHILLMQDYTIRAGRVKNGFGGITWDYLGPATSYTVPRSGEFTLESQVSITPSSFCTDTGGFAVANVYQNGRPATGDPVVRGIGVYNIGENFNIPSTPRLSQFRVGAPQGTKVMGMGVALPTGTKKRWLYDTFFAPAFPYADGNVSESIVSYEHYEEWGTQPPDGLEPQIVGTKITWGSLQRWRNLLRRNQTTAENLLTDTHIGGGGGLDGIWNDGGPFYPDSDDTARSRNTIVDNAMDIVLTRLTRPGVKTIEGIGLTHIAGIVAGRGGTGFELFGGESSWWNYYGPHPYDYQDDPTDDWNWPLGNKHAAFKMYLKLDSGLYVMRTGHLFTPAAGSSHWQPSPAGYLLSPRTVLPRDPATGKVWSPTKMPGIAYQGNTAEAEAAAENPRQAWVEFDVTSVALQVAYHKLLIASQFLPQVPVARYEIADFYDNLTFGLAAIYDTSVDFNGYFEDITDLTRMMDWGDGAPLEEIPSGIEFPGDESMIVYHHYLHGTWTATLHVTNSKGLTSTFSREFTVPVGAATANFSYAADEYDPLTLHFTDLSVVINGIAVGWSWDFGDSSTSTDQDPTHTFAAPGVYTITFEVTGDSGQTDLITVDITVGTPVAGDCPIFEDDFADDAWVQGDDFAGGNPPLPSYINTAAFDVYYGGSTFRYTYDFTNGPGGGGSSYDIDNTEQYDGHASLVGYYGPGSFGQYIWCDVTDDGHSSEAFPPSTVIGDDDLWGGSGTQHWPRRGWIRMIFKSETGVMGDGTRTTAGTGLQICQFHIGSGWAAVFLRQSKLKIDVRRKPTALGAFASSNIADLADESDIATGAGGQWKELIFGYVGDEANDKMRVMAWFGDACTLEGTLPTIDQTLDNFDTFMDYSVAEFFNTFYTTSANGSDKKLWLAGFRTQPNKINPNPFNVSIPSGVGYP